MRHRRPQPPPPWARFLAALSLATLLAVACAGLWHRHSDSTRPHDDCAVCTAAAADTSDGLPPRLAAPPRPPLLGLITTPAPRDPSIRATRFSQARGPPSA